EYITVTAFQKRGFAGVTTLFNVCYQESNWWIFNGYANARLLPMKEFLPERQMIFTFLRSLLRCGDFRLSQGTDANLGGFLKTLSYDDAAHLQMSQ
ncbi:hypothetical protein CEXT_221871, partial [Caerostris extrusa]